MPVAGGPYLDAFGVVDLGISPPNRPGGLVSAPFCRADHGMAVHTSSLTDAAPKARAVGESGLGPLISSQYCFNQPGGHRDD